MIEKNDDRNYEDRIKELKEELKRRKESGSCSEPDILELENTIKTMEYLASHPLSKSEFDSDSILKEEYRSDGYFNSEDFKEKCDEFEKYLRELRKERTTDFTRFEYVTLKKAFMRRKYNLNWVPEEEQYIDGVVVNVD